MYSDVEIEVIKGKDKGTEPYALNPNNINYYRGFTDDSSQLKTMVYMQGSVKGVIVNCGFDYLRSQLNKHRQVQEILMELNAHQLEQVKSFVDSIKKEGA